MEEKQYHIMVVDDEADLCDILKFNLESEGYAVDVANSAEEALQKGVVGEDLLLLDVMMDEMSGFDMARQLKKNELTAHIPIIFLTARGAENDKVTGFNLGADDYISKPFSIREVLLRVRAVLRRSSGAIADDEQHVLSLGGLAIDFDRKTVVVDGKDVPFTKTEFGILCTLFEHPHHVYSRHDLIRRIWPTDVMVTDRTVDVNITRVRKKLGPYSHYISTRLGFGYFFDAD